LESTAPLDAPCACPSPYGDFTIKHSRRKLFSDFHPGLLGLYDWVPVRPDSDLLVLYQSVVEQGLPVEMTRLRVNENASGAGIHGDNRDSGVL
jgi:hypothetical protein